MKLRQINLYKKGDTTPSGQPLPYFKVNELINDLIVSSDYVNRLNEVNDFNKNNRWKKRNHQLKLEKFWKIFRCLKHILKHQKRRKYFSYVF